MGNFLRFKITLKIMIRHNVGDQKFFNNLEIVLIPFEKEYDV